MVLGSKGDLPIGLCPQLTFSTISGLFKVRAQNPWVNRKGPHALSTTERFKGSVVGRAREHAAWGERSLTTGTGTESQVLEEVSQDRVL